MKVVFLDFDGVLVNRKSWFVRSGCGATADPPCVEALNTITDATGASIVISSTWRVGRTLPQLREILIGWAIKASVIGRTPWMPAKSRGAEIKAWLEDWSASRDSVTQFVILDDDSDMEALTPRLVLTKFDLGLTADHVAQAIRILNKAEPAQ